MLTIETKPTTLTEGLIEVPIHNPDIAIVPEINTILNNQTQIVAINPSNERKMIALPPAEVSQPTHILVLHHEKAPNRLQTLRSIIKLDHLEQTEQKRLLQLIETYSEIFFIKGDKLQSNVKHFHEIRTKENTLPIHVKNYRFPIIHKAEVENQMKDLLKQGIIQPSESAWNAPIWVVPKKIDQSGKQKWRIVVDYRRLNQVTHPDKYPLPNIDDIFDALHNSKIFTTIDLASGFHQISIHPRDIEKTGFSTHNGHYEFKKMPFGLINAPATFQRVMNQALSGTIGSECFVYLDDIIVFSDNFETHLRKLNIVFQRLREHKLLIQLDKTEFLKPEVFYLGHTLSANGLGLQQIKVEKILNYPRPTNVKEVQRLLGMAGYYRRFIENYSKKTKSLTLLTRKNVNFKWTAEHEKDFQNLRNELSAENLVLQFPDFEKEFFLNTDASDYAIGSVLAQEDHEGNRKPIAYASRTLNKSECNYATIEKELLSIVWSVKHFRPYLYGRNFTILTDHKPLEWLFNITDPGSRLLRWRLKLEEYQYTIKHISGTQNPVADALSRIHILQTLPITTEDMKAIKPSQADVIIRFTTTEQTPNLSVGGFERKNNTITFAYKDRLFTPFDLILFRKFSKKIKELINDDSKLIGIIDCTDSGQSSEYSRMRTERILQTCFAPYTVAWILEDEPKNKKSMLEKMHTHPLAIHPGINRMHKQLIDNGYHWKNMKNDITEIVNACEECKLNKHVRQKSKLPLVITDTASEPFQKISLDFVGPLPLTYNGNQHILTLQDDLTKFVVLKATPTTETALVAKHLISIFCQYGIPESIRTDQGSAFCSNLIKEITTYLGIKKVECSPYHPESNGALERTHGSIKQSLRFQINCDRSNWDEFIDITGYSFNTAIHSSTGKTPFELLFGIKPRLPYLQTSETTKLYEEYATETKQRLTELRQKAVEIQVSNKEKTKKRYDKKHNAKFAFTPGDKVRLVTRNIQGKRGALGKPFEGPYNVTAVSYPNVTIELDGKEKTFHANLLRPFTQLSLLQILLFIFLFPLTLAINFENVITTLYDKNGLYENSLGTVGNHIADYTFLTGFTLHTIRSNIDMLQRMEESIEKLSQRINTKPDTEEEIALLPQLRDHYENLITSPGSIHHRTKRQVLVGGAIAALSFIAGRILGTDATITDLQKDEKTIAEAVRHNIHIINTTVYNFEKEMNRIEETKNIYDKALRLIVEHVHTLERNESIHNIIKVIYGIKQHFTTVATITLDQLQTIQNAVIFAKKKLIHPAVVSNRKLRQYLYEIHPPSRTSNTMLPIEIQKDTSLRTVQKYSEICEIESEIIGNNIIFAISVPLIENNEYFLYELLSFPYADSYPSTHLKTIIPSSRYAIFSKRTNRYIFYEDYELSRCTQVTPTFFVCQLHNLHGILHAPCEIGIHFDDTSACNGRTKSIVAESETWHYLNANRWLFALNNPSRITIDCSNGTSYQQQLPNRGILSLPSTCVASSREYVFYPHSDIISGKPTDYHEMPRFNFSEEKLQPIAFTPIIIPKVESFNPQHLHQLYNAQQEEMLHFESQLSHGHPWLTFSNIAYTTFVFIVIATLFCCYRRRQPPPPQEQAPLALGLNFNQQPAVIEDTEEQTQRPRRSIRLQNLRRINFHNE